MTDIVALAQKAYRQINQQNTPVQVNWTDLVWFTVDAIETLYVISGRSQIWSDDKIVCDETGVPSEFADDLGLDEREWIVLKTQIAFYKWVQSSVND